MTAVMGIDPGLQGGIAIIGPECIAEPMPLMTGGKRVCVETIRKIVQAHDPSLVAVEEQRSFGQGRQSAFTSGRNYQAILTVLELFGAPHLVVAPSLWKSVLRGTKRDKAAAIEFVHRRYPWVDLKPGKCRKDHDGIADAVCIAEWARGQV